MADKNDMIRQIEEMLGADGSRELAESMFEVLREEKLFTFNEHDGFQLAEVDEHKWLALLETADGRLTE